MTTYTAKIYELKNEYGINVMFKYLFSTLFLLLMTEQSQSQTTISGSFVHDGLTRTYSYYVPASYVPGSAVPLVLGLHGTSSSGADFAQFRDFRPIADTANFIIVNPDGSTMFGISFWNYGNVLGSTVDDVGFLEALIDTISANYTIDSNRIYCTGMSNGSFMAYALACQSNRFAAIAGVTGSMSVNMYNDCNPIRPIPTMHIHGTEDATNPYTGTSTMKAIEDVTQFWVDQNNCDINPSVTSIPDTDPNDGATAERYLYENGDYGHTVELFKVIGGEHTWPNAPMPLSSEVTCMDFDASKEIWRFFSQYEISSTASLESQDTFEDVNLYPNPALENFSISAGDNVINEVVILDTQGRAVRKYSNEDIQLIDVRMLKAGNYFVKISGENFSTIKKLIVQ